jgi:hypothetical protein
MKAVMKAARRNLNNEGTHHDPISGLEDSREVVQTFLILNLHNQH